MTDVDVFRPLRSKESDAGRSGGEDVSGEFNHSVSGSSASDVGEGGKKHPYSARQGQQDEEIHQVMARANINDEMRERRDGAGLSLLPGGWSKYGMEPMGLVFGETIDDDPPEKTERERVMSAKTPTRPPISIKRIGDYDLIKTIGSGSTGKVKLAINYRTQEKCAVKIIPRTQFAAKKSSRETTEARERRILREAAILNLIDHQHIVKLRDFLITRDYFCMFFEYIEGVQLLDYIISHRKLSEPQARTFFRQVLSAVDYCHRNSIVHRDLKIENILVDSVTGDIKLLDFGLSNFYDPDDSLHTFCGSLYFAAPELLSGKIYTGPEVDVWSLGVILFVLVTGHVPFDDKNLAALHQKIKSCRLEMPEFLGDGCRELLNRMICRDPSKRATMDDVIFHPWVNEGFIDVPAYLAPERLPIESVDDRVVIFLEREFNIQYSKEEIHRVLRMASNDWSSAFQHPLVSLYFLARDKLLLDGSLRTVPVKVDSKERSRSVSYIAQGSNSESSLALPAAAFLSRHGGRKFSAPAPSPPSQSVNKHQGQYVMASIDESHPPGHHPRRNSYMETGNLLHSERDFLGIKTVYLKGFFSANITTHRSPMAIRNELLQYLILHNIHYDDRRSYFVCEHQASLVSTRFDEARADRVGKIIFEIHIVKLAFVGMHGVQFKRIQGDIAHYKNLVSQMVAALKL